MTVKVDTNSEPPVFIQTEVVDESEPELKSKVIEEPEAEVEEPLIETPVVLPAEPTMELLSFLPFMRFFLFLKSPDMYDPLQIYLQETC